MIGIIDAAAAAKFLLPTARLQNTAGKFVTPDRCQPHRRYPALQGQRRRRDEDRRPDIEGSVGLPAVAADLGGVVDQGDQGRPAEMADMLDYVRALASSPVKRSASCPTGTLP